MWIAIALLLLLLATGIVLLPFFRPPSTVQQDFTVDARLHALFTKRDQLYQSIREAKFDLDTGKLSPEDYERQTTTLKRQAASVLKAIDHHEDNLIPQQWDEEIEQQVRAMRRQNALTPIMASPTSSTSQSRYCPQCGTRVNQDDRFCPVCGASIS